MRVNNIFRYGIECGNMNKTCVLCGNTKFIIISKKVRDSSKHKVVKCLNCEHIQLFPIPSIEEEEKFYDENLQEKNINNYGSIKRVRRKMMPDDIRRADFMSKITSKKEKILEIGSGYGFFLEIMKKRNYDIIGIEVSKIKREYSQKFTDVKVLDIDINDKIPQIGPFHKIVLFQTLEHIINPIKFLKNANKLLKKGGKIIVEVPNLNDFHLRVNTRYRNFWWERAHINYFTPKILNHVLKRAGFKKLKIIGVQRYSIENFFHWRITNLPQMENPTYTLSDELVWIEQYYKDHLQRKLLCDTVIIVGEKD